MIPSAPPEQKQQAVLIIMSKAPLPGRCKTRLAPRLGLRGAARIQRQLLQQRIALGLTLPCQVEIHASPDVRHPLFLQARRLGIRVRKQCHGDLGRRMRCAQGQRPAIIIGTDCPALTREHLLMALSRLQQNQATCIPAQDGGYVLLAQPQANAGLFHTIDWGSSRVMQQTRRQQRRSKTAWLNSTPLPDLDTPQDFQQQRRAGRLPAY